MSRKIRIEDVAREAGVSPTAVSFAFNSPQRLNALTVDRILRIADSLGYAPNPHARALLAKSVGVIGILTPEALPSVFANPFFPAFHQGVGNVCDVHDLSLLTISVSSSLSDATAKAPVDGLIIVGLNESHPEIELLHRRKMPFVIVDGDAVRAPSVNVDDEGGAYSAAAYLLERGHRQILCLTFEPDYSASHVEKVYGVGQRRLTGHKRAFDTYGVRWDDDFLIPTGTSASGGVDAFRLIWAGNRRPTALLTVADVIAIGALQAAAENGVRVPNDLAIVGFDDIPYAKWTCPPLTTVRQPIVEKGELAAQLLLSLIAGNLASDSSLTLPCELIVRQSA
jgi:DNA-binding LacI/PurR family transcriptional regulator